MRALFGLWPLALLAALGAIGIGLATTWGVALSNDSVNYLRAARALVEGRDFTITQYQPLYPAVLGTGARLGPDLLSEARWLGAALFALNVVLIGAFVCRYACQNAWAAVLSAALFTTSVPVLRLHSYALSEPLFLALTTGCQFGLCAALEHRQVRYVLLAGACAGLALLTRYLGAPLILVGAVALVWLDRRRSPARLLAFLGLAVLPTAAWLAHNVNVSGRFTDREIALHPLTGEHLRGAATLLAWLVPSTLAKPLASSLPAGVLRLASSPGARVALGVLLVALGVLLVALVVWRLWRARRRIDWPVWSPELRLLALFIVVYPLAVLGSIVLFDANTQPDSRILSPVQLAGIVLLGCWLGRLAPSLGPAARRAVRLTATGVVALHAAGAVVYVATSHADGQGYASRQWQQSSIVATLRTWPAPVVVYASQSEAVLALTTLPARDLPWKVRAISRAPNDDYDQQMQAVVDQVRSGQAIVAMLYDAATAEEPYRSYLPSEAELRDRFGLRLLRQTSDGAIYGLTPA